MRKLTAGWMGALVCAAMAGCGGGGGGTVTPVATITGVTVSVTASSITTKQTSQASAAVTGTGSYSSAVSWSVSPSTIGSMSSTGLFTPSAAGTATITATSSQDSTKSGSAKVTVTAPATTVTVSPGSPTVTVGTSQQFTASASGVSTQPTWEWTLAGPSGWSGDVGTISSTGLYQSPYPAPATVIVTATSAADTSVSGSTTVTLSAPATAAGPVLTVDVGNQMHPISPFIYGANGWQLDTTSATTANYSILRWGGDATSRYNYKLNTTNSASDWHFENFSGQNGAYPDNSNSGNFTQFVSATDGAGMAAIGTVPVQGWVSNSSTGNTGSTPACSFPESSYPNQADYDQQCGNGICQNGKTCGYLTCTAAGGCSLYGSATTPAITSVQEPPPACTIATLSSGCANGVSSCMVQTCSQSALPTAANATSAWANGTWAGGWVNSIVTGSGYGTGGSGKGVAMWDLDNEPAWWDAVHRDVHPSPSTYDEVTWGGISTALAIKTADSTAQVNGPIIDYWWNYFYSKKDIESGWGSGGPCYEPWSHPVDRDAHGGVAMIPYYLEKMNQASTTYGMRLLDYLDIHGYFASDASGHGLGLTTAGDTSEQTGRMNSVRALWDPTYTNVNYPQPNYSTDANYTTNCNTPLQAPEVIPMLHAWVNGTTPLGDPNNNYPGTKTAIDEYNFGGLESINGAVTQADVLGIFGQYGLDMGTLWPTTNYNLQGPGNYAFAMYRNYDGKDSGFGNEALASCSTTAALSGACTPADTHFQPVANMETGQGSLSVYGALRTSDNAITVMVINKTYGPLTSTVSLENATGLGASASVYQYTAANLTAIQKLSDAAVTAPSGGGTTSTISYTFPGQSITLFIIQ